MTTDLRYPIGRYQPYRDRITDDVLGGWIDEIEALPGELRRAVEPLTDEQLDTRYRPGGWTLRQVVHHVPDSHLHCYVRFKWALTEDRPKIKVYEEARWAELEDYRTVPVSLSLDFLEVIHRKWVGLMRVLTPEQWRRRFEHPDYGLVDLAHTAGMYAWHGKHHLGHVRATVERKRADE